MQFLLILRLSLPGQNPDASPQELTLPQGTTDEQLAEKVMGREELESLDLFYRRAITDKGSDYGSWKDLNSETRKSPPSGSRASRTRYPNAGSPISSL